MFPFPEPDETRSLDSPSLSYVEIGMLEKAWKANHAVRDDTLIQKLCDTLQDILGDKVLSEHSRNTLLAKFSPRLELDEFDFGTAFDGDWLENPNEVHVSFSSWPSYSSWC